MNYDQLLMNAETDDRILGLVLGGSRGKGMVSEHSDWDVNLLVRAEDKDALESELQPTERTDLVLYALPEFDAYAAWGSAEAWDRYDFEHAKVLVDKTGGEIERIVREKSVLPESAKEEVVTVAMNAFLNGVFRSLKDIRDGRMFTARLGALEIVPWYFITAIFGLEGRLKPYDKYLLWEVEHHPLKALSWTAGELQDKLEKLMRFDDPKRTLLEFVDALEQAVRGTSFGNIFDEWEKELKWMRQH